MINKEKKVHFASHAMEEIKKQGEIAKLQIKKMKILENLH
jgi:hypothetical protein